MGTSAFTSLSSTDTGANRSEGGQEKQGDRAPLLDLDPSLAELFPDQALRRGSVVMLSGEAGATSLLLALVSGPLAAGSWGAVVAMPALGMEAAAGLGVRLDRLALVPYPGSIWLEVVAAFLDTLDLVVVRPPGRCRPSDARRLAARARERGSVLAVALVAQGGEPSWNGDRLRGAWSEPTDIQLRVEASRWHGIGAGHGALGSRQLEVVATARRGAVRERRARPWLP